MLSGDGLLLELALEGRLDEQELARWLGPLGVEEQAAVLVFALPDPHGGLPLLERCLSRAGVPGSATAYEGMLCAIVACPDGRSPADVGARARGELSEQMRDVRAAASRPAPLSMVRRSFGEARFALNAAHNADGHASEVALYEDLGALKLLLSLQPEDALESYCRNVLGPVEAEGREYGEELLRSLDAFVEHNGHWEHAAKALYCHRHTLRYRIRRVERLTKRDLSRARDRIELWLALRGRELVG